MLPLHKLVTGSNCNATQCIPLFGIVHNIRILSNEDTSAMIYAVDRYLSKAGLGNQLLGPHMLLSWD